MGRGVVGEVSVWRGQPGWRRVAGSSGLELQLTEVTKLVLRDALVVEVALVALVVVGALVAVVCHRRPANVHRQPPRSRRAPPPTSRTRLTAVLLVVDVVEATVVEVAEVVATADVVAAVVEVSVVR